MVGAGFAMCFVGKNYVENVVFDCCKELKLIQKQ